MTSVFVLLLLLNVVWLGWGPPRHIVVSTGAESAGAYHFYGQQYAEQLREMGLEVDLLPSEGSMANIDRLARGEADVAFVQSGLVGTTTDDTSRLRALAAIYLSPVWVFYRREIGNVDHLNDLALFRIAVGPHGSGTHAIALRLLQENGIDTSTPRTVTMSISDSSEALRKGDVDAAMMVISPASPHVQELLSDPQIALLSFRRAMAYSRRFPEFQSVTLGEGTIDLRKNIPQRDYQLIATSVVLVASEDLHARAVEQILVAANEIHHHGGVLEEPETFPSLKRVAMPIHVAARHYMKSGESFTSRLLPYMVLRWILRLQLLVLPLLAIWLPLVRVLPALYRMRINSLLKLHYGALREIENAILTATSVDDLQRQLQSLVNLRDDMERLSRKIPAHHQSDIYHWRLHISLVQREAADRRDALQQIAAESPAPPNDDATEDATDNAEAEA